MNRVVKWLLIICGGLFVVILAIILIAPSLIDINKYRPQIENAVSEATGRPFTLGEDLRLSLFPWASVAVNDVHLGNPPGFEEKDLLRLETFDRRFHQIIRSHGFFGDFTDTSCSWSDVLMRFKMSTDSRPYSRMNGFLW